MSAAADLTVIDQFLSDYSTYIDSGFGLVGGEVGRLSNALIAIDVTLAGLFWTLDPNSHLLSRFIRKILYVGAFAFIISNFNLLSTAIFNSFARLGLQAGAAQQSSDLLLKPGRLASAGYEAALPLLDQAAQLLGFPEFFGNFVVIIVLMLAWVLVLAAFFILAVQLFVTILEFKLTTLAGFVLTPFALWNKTSFLAERVLGAVMASGVKVMVLAIIIGIGTGLFARLGSDQTGQEADILQALGLVLAAASLLGLGIFGPALASGLVTGGPQLGAGAAAGTAMAVAGGAGMAAGAIGGGRLAVSGVLSAVRAASNLGRSPGLNPPSGQGPRPGPPGRPPASPSSSGQGSGRGVSTGSGQTGSTPDPSAASTAAGGPAPYADPAHSRSPPISNAEDGAQTPSDASDQARQASAPGKGVLGSSAHRDRPGSEALTSLGSAAGLIQGALGQADSRGGLSAPFSGPEEA